MRAAPWGLASPVDHIHVPFTPVPRAIDWPYLLPPAQSRGQISPFVLGLFFFPRSWGWQWGKQGSSGTVLADAKPIRKVHEPRGRVAPAELGDARAGVSENWLHRAPLSLARDLVLAHLGQAKIYVIRSLMQAAEGKDPILRGTKRWGTHASLRVLAQLADSVHHPVLLVQGTPHCRHSNIAK